MSFMALHIGKPGDGGNSVHSLIVVFIYLFATMLTVVFVFLPGCGVQPREGIGTSGILIAHKVGLFFFVCVHCCHMSDCVFCISFVLQGCM